MLHINIQSSIGAFIQCSGVRSSLSYLIPVLDKLSIVFGIIFNILLLLEKPGLWTHASGSDQRKQKTLLMEIDSKVDFLSVCVWETYHSHPRHFHPRPQSEEVRYCWWTTYWLQTWTFLEP